MKKTDFIKMVAEKADMTQKEVTTVIDAFEEVMMEEVFAKEDSVRLAMGVFSGYTKPATKARKGRNPATGEEITIAAKPAQSGQPKVKFSKAAKE
jgi:DNA-binding protein HU-beta